MAIPLSGRRDSDESRPIRPPEDRPELPATIGPPAHVLGDDTTADAEVRSRFAAERLAVRLRWLSIVAIPLLVALGPEPVHWPPFLALVASAVGYNLAIAFSLSHGRRPTLLSYGTTVVDSLYLTILSHLSGGLDSMLTTYMCLAMVSACMRLPFATVLGMAALYAAELTLLAAIGGRLGDGLLPARVLYVFLTVPFVLPLVQESRARFAEVLAGHSAQRRLLHRLLLSAEEERRRIAGDLHDRGGGALFTLLHGLRRLRELMHPPDRAAAVEVDRLIGTTEATVKELRGFLADLRPQLLDDLGLAEALRDLLARERALSSIKVAFDVDPEVRPDPESALALYRVAQEALTNVRRHAAARAATVRLAGKDGGWQLTIEDDGKGVVGTGSGLGLRTMRERVDALGGRLWITSAAGRGTRISAWVPRPHDSGTGDGHSSFSR